MFPGKMDREKGGLLFYNILMQNAPTMQNNNIYIKLKKKKYIIDNTAGRFSLKDYKFSLCVTIKTIQRHHHPSSISAGTPHTTFFHNSRSIIAITR